MAEDQINDNWDAGKSIGENALDRALPGSDESMDTAALEQWLAADPERRKLYEQFHDPAQLKAMLSASRQMGEPMSAELQRLYAEIDPVPTLQARRAIHKLVNYLSGAAAIALIAVCTLLLLRHTSKTHSIPPRAVAPVSDIKPGGNKATLTLGNGTQILLDSAHTGLLARQGGYQVVKQANGTIVYSLDNKKEVAVLYNTVTTPRGGQYRLRLPDGTGVWLNAASSITYPTAFTGARRDVAITGEAYFEVSANKSSPFTVKAGKAKIKVLGTHFNVMAYPDEKDLETTLLQGAVSVTQGEATKILRPDQQARISTRGTLSVANVHADDYVAWKNGLMELHNADLATVMRQISRWYDVEVVYEGKNMPTRTLGGVVPRTLNLSEVLKVLQLMGINYRLEDRKLTVLLSN